jgi:bacterioferritin
MYYKDLAKGEVMAITIDQLVKLLNHDLELEYSAAIQYINHSAVMTGAAYGDIIKELKIHTNQEIQHAMILADQIDFLEEKPSVMVGEIRTSQDNQEMLRQDLEGEQDVPYAGTNSGLSRLKN